ncbi:RNase P subunit p30 family protein [Haloplanus halophilus]|uniref:RNase P subunit p30 family protein n=1 Tax=Haloplanus halophilus TaxID=2949993 RepID=UPI0020410838|nr:RNase P subunit p30 family protein [Haloplanus sp. GDY1]
MYEAVHVAPDGDSPATRVAETAARLGFDGVVIRAREASPDLDALRAETDIDVVDGAEVTAADPEGASGAVGGLRPKRTVLVVRGGTDRLNRFAVENERVDVLSRPMADDGDVNHVLCNRAAENGVRIEFDFGPVLRSTGGPRVQALQDLRKLRELVADAGAPFVVSANPASHLQLRAPRELVAVGEAVGFDPDTVRAGLREWGDLAARNRHRQSESFIEPGVERGPYEEDA